MASRSINCSCNRKASRHVRSIAAGCSAMVILVYCLVLIGCRTKVVSLSTPQVVDWPERGWRLYPSARTSLGLGSVFGETRQEIGEISDVEIEMPKAEVDYPAERRLEQNTAAKFGLFANFVLRQSEAGDVNLSFTNEKSIKIEISVRGAKRFTLKDKALEQAIRESVKISDKDLWQYSSYWVRAEVETATNISFTLNDAALRYFGGDAKFNSMVTTHAGIQRQFTNGNTIVITSEEPLAIAYHPKRIDPRKLQRFHEEWKKTVAEDSKGWGQQPIDIRSLCRIERKLNPPLKDGPPLHLDLKTSFGNANASMFVAIQSISNSMASGEGGAFALYIMGPAGV